MGEVNFLAQALLEQGFPPVFSIAITTRLAIQGGNGTNKASMNSYN